MSDEPEDMVPEGAAVFPLIPEELGVNPVLLATLHALVFLIGSSEEVLNPEAGEEALQYMITYLQRLKGTALNRVRADFEALKELARSENWPEPEELRRKVKPQGPNAATVFLTRVAGAPTIPNETPVGDANSSGAFARTRSIRPPPSRVTGTSCVPARTGTPVSSSADLIWATVHEG